MLFVNIYFHIALDMGGGKHVVCVALPLTSARTFNYYKGTAGCMKMDFGSCANRVSP
jgi:hypothetical protein